MSTFHIALRDLGIQAVNSGGSTGSPGGPGRNDGTLVSSINPSTGEQIAESIPVPLRIISESSRIPRGVPDLATGACAQTW
ncbi:MAG: hypothetical protein MRJ68_12230 [Nitrospira sp.]|nr:hypothetical protein [Nitrospira sp.]